MKRAGFPRSPVGITLVEMMVTLMVVGVIFAAAIPSLTSLIERRRVIAAAGEIASIFAYARSETNVVADKLNVHLEPVPASVGDFSCIRVSTAVFADTCKCNVAESDVCKIGTGSVLREFKLPRDKSVSFEAEGTWAKGKPYVVSFERDRHSTTVQGVQVTVTGARTHAQLRVEYNNAGRVRTCSPGGSISGFPACG